ncbi:hypothetical protein FQR65_LT18962 [Abscondita terminalis]|nr:hypothetical protein FQR65_LT18962 [Abscondita terminalis]
MKKILGIRNINNKIINIYIINNKIYLNKPENTNEDEFQNIILDKDIYVSYGWIDSHVHCDKENKLYGSEIDEIGFHQGVTTVIDAGSVGIDDISRMYDYSKKAITNLKIILNISKKGIYKQSELSNLNDISINFNEKKFKNFIVGYKARMSSSVTLESGTKALEIFNQIRDEQNIKLPLMVHIGNEPPVFGDIFPKLRKNDVITHIFNYKNYSIFDKNYEITESLNMAIEKGIKFDVGHDGRMTILGVSKISNKVSEGMKYAGENFFVMKDFKNYINDEIRKIIKSDDICVVNSASAGIALSVAAAVYKDRVFDVNKKVELKNQIVIPKGHNIDYGTSVESMIYLVGAKPVEAGFANTCSKNDIQYQINENTAAIMYVVSHHCVQKNMLTLDEAAEIAAKNNLPLIVDCAAEEDFQKYNKYDVVIFSGSKAIEGPTSGIVFGKRIDLISDVKKHLNIIGRAMKIGKENIYGLLIALQNYELVKKINFEEYYNIFTTNKKLDLSKNIDNRGIERIRFKLLNSKMSAKDLSNKLREGEIAIYLRDYFANEGILDIDLRNISLEEAKIINKEIERILGAGDPKQSFMVASLAKKIKPAHANQVFTGVGLTVDNYSNNEVFINCLCAPTGKPGFVKISTGPLSSQKEDAIVSIETAIAMIKDMGGDSIKFFPMKGLSTKEEFKVVAKACAENNFSLEPTGGIDLDNFKEIMQIALDAGVKYIIPHVYNSIIDSKTVSDAAGLGLLNYKTKKYDSNLLSYSNISIKALPDILNENHFFKFSKNGFTINLSLGTSDGAAAALGSIENENDLSLSLGTTLGIRCISNSSIELKTEFDYCFPIYGEKYIYGISSSNAGNVIEVIYNKLKLDLSKIKYDINFIPDLKNQIYLFKERKSRGVFKIMDEKIVNISMELIATSGSAKSMALGAINLAKDGKKDEANQMYIDAKKELTKVHQFHAELISKEASGEKFDMSLLFVHAQDHLTSAIIILDLAMHLINLYTK